MGFIQDKTAGLVQPRTLVLVALLAGPIAIYAIAGAVAIWQVGWLRWLWWLAPIFWAIAWVVGKLWPNKVADEFTSIQPDYWTPRDEEAVEIIRRYQREVSSFDSEQLTDPQFYLLRAQLIANELAKHYRPNTPDPISHRTLPEILAACRMVADDLEQLVLTSVPGSRLLTVNQWRKLGEAPNLVRQATKAFWATKILLNPFNLAQWGTSKVTHEKVATSLQSEILATLYMRFVRQLGYYLIEMNSGRLRGGADSYRLAFNRLHVREKSRQNLPPELLSSAPRSSSAPSPIAPSPEGTGEDERTAKPAEKNNAHSSQAAGAEELLPIKIVVLGQRGSGKSTLIQTLLEDKLPYKRAADFKPAPVAPTRKAVTHEYEVMAGSAKVFLLDTPGYEPHSSGKKLTKSVAFAVNHAHAILLLLHSDAVTWDVDKELLERIRESYRSQENLKPPKVIAVVIFGNQTRDITNRENNLSEFHAEQSMTNHPPETDRSSDQPLPGVGSAIGRAKTQFGDLVEEYVPLHFEPTDEQQLAFKVQLIAKLTQYRESARSSAMLASYEQSLNRGRYTILFQQAKTSGKKLFSNWLKGRP